jgi:hypothetical protein
MKYRKFTYKTYSIILRMKYFTVWDIGFRPTKKLEDPFLSAFRYCGEEYLDVEELNSITWLQWPSYSAGYCTGKALDLYRFGRC